MTPAEKLAPAVFVDKDGTLVEDVPYNANPLLIRWREEALETLARLAAAGFELVVVTNQSGLAHGLFSAHDLRRYFDAFMRQAADAGVRFASIEYCPHHPEASVARLRRFCSCRKPNPGMLARAARRHRLDLTRSWMVGDLLDDVEAGARAGCMTALAYHDGNEPVPARGIRRPDVIATDLAEAARAIAARSEAVA